MTGAVVITGFGIVSPLGHSLPELARRVAAGEQAATTADGSVIASIPLDVIPAAARTRIGRLDRLCRLALAASYLALDDAAVALPLAAPQRVGLVFGSGLGCLLSNAEFYAKIVAQGAAAASPRAFASTVSSAAAGEVSIALGVHGPNTTMHMGLAAGVAALGYAMDLVGGGRADMVLAGGVDALDAWLATALRDMGLFKTPAQARPFLDAVPGLWPSEGAAIAVVESAAHAAARGARVRARLLAYAAGFEPTLSGRAPLPHGVVATLRRALAGQPAPARVLVSAHGTPCDAIERAALQAVGLGAVPVVAPKACLGDAFGASGAFAAALASAGAPTPALISALCPSGSIAALLVEACAPV